MVKFKPESNRRSLLRSNGYSLVELMVSLPLMVAIVAAAGGLIIAVSNAQNLSNGLMANRIASLETQQRLLSDLQFTPSLAECSLNAVEFSSFDRNADGREESLRYSWSGTPGDPVMYSYNNSVPESLVDDVHQFELNYSEIYDKSETLLQSHNDSIAGQFLNFAIDDDTAASQYFIPALPGLATAWTINRVRIRARSVGVADGLVNVSLVKAEFQKPSGSVYETTRIRESELDEKFSWFDVYFARLNDLGPDVDLCIVITGDGGTDVAAEIAYETSGDKMPGNTHWLSSTNGGLTWSEPDNVSDMRFFVIGDHNGLDYRRSAVQNIQLAMQVGSDPSARTLSTVRLINEPEKIPVLIIDHGQVGDVDPQPEPDPSTDPSTDPNTDPSADPNTDPAPLPDVERETDPAPEPEPGPIPVPDAEQETDPAPDPDPAPAPVPDADRETDSAPNPASEPTTDAEPGGTLDTETVPTPGTGAETESETAPETVPASSEGVEPEPPSQNDGPQAEAGPLDPSNDETPISPSGTQLPLTGASP